jgi:transcription antitermination factor NusG
MELKFHWVKVQVPLNSCNSIEEKKEMQINATNIENMFFIYIICNLSCEKKAKKCFFILCDLWLCCMIEGSFEKTQIQKDAFQCFKNNYGKSSSHTSSNILLLKIIALITLWRPCHDICINVNFFQTYIFISII